MKKLVALFLSIPIVCLADLNSLDDIELAEINGEGLGFVLENFVYDASDAEVTIYDISGTEKIDIEDLYIMGAGSQQGATTTPINLGRLNNPYQLNLVDIEGADLQGVSFKFPVEEAGDGGADLGIRTRFKVAGNSRVPNGSLDVLKASATGYQLDGSEWRLWGNGSKTFGDLHLRLRIDDLNIRSASCSGLSTNCSADSTLVKPIQISGIGADIRLGYGDIFPVNFNVTADGHFRLQATGLNASNYHDYYDASVSKSFIYIDNITLQATSNSAAVNLGQNYISGIRLQYLDIQTHDL